MKKSLLLLIVLIIFSIEENAQISGNIQAGSNFTNQGISLEFVASTQAGNIDLDLELPAGIHICVAPNKKALITDVRHVIRQMLLRFEIDSTKRLELNYFVEHEQFTNSILKKIEKLTKEKFDVTEVVFLQPNKIDFCFGLEQEELNIKTADRASADIFVSIVSINNNDLNLKFRIIVENKKGKKIFKQNIKIPIAYDSLSGTYIYGSNGINMSDEKFQQLYELGLSAVFEKEKIKFERQFVTRPIHKDYVDFYSQSNTFFLIRDKDRYFLEDENGEISEPAFFILNGKGKGVREGINWNFGSFANQKFKKHSFLHNNILSENYITKTQGSSRKRFGAKSKGMPSVDFYHNDSTIGYFQLHSNDSFDGHFNNTNYSIGRSKKPPFYEISAEDQLIAIIRYRPSGHYIINFLNSVTSEEQSKVINVIFAWEEAMRMMEILESK